VEAIQARRVRPPPEARAGLRGKIDESNARESGSCRALFVTQDPRISIEQCSQRLGDDLGAAEARPAGQHHQRGALDRGSSISMVC